jgi:DNA-binding transcriptional regulator GbsR (MarR family)
LGDSQKKFQKPLDILVQKYYNEYTTEEGKPHQTRKATPMKKSTLQSLVSYLTEKGDESMQEVLAELTAELAKGQTKVDATRKEYDEMREQVMEVLRSATLPVSAQEIADETGLSKGKIVYGLTRLWAADVAKTEGKVSTYALKA